MPWTDQLEVATIKCEYARDVQTFRYLEQLFDFFSLDQAQTFTLANFPSYVPRCREPKRRCIVQ